MSATGSSPRLSRAEIRVLLNEIGSEFAAKGAVAEISIYGGAALLLMFDNRPVTRDIDFTLKAGTVDDITSVADAVGDRHGLPHGWFNDAVRMFVSDRPDLSFFGDFPVGGPAGLRVFVASPRYMLAMKILSMRSALESSDMLDVWNLLDECGIASVDDASHLVKTFFPDEAISPRNADYLEDIFADKQSGRSYDAMRFW